MDEQTEVRDLLAAWALDAVDDVDRARVERAIRQDPSLAREARLLVETSARLAESVAAPPPPALRAQVLTAVDSVPQRPAATYTAAVRPPRRPRPRVATWIVAAAVATMAVIAPSVLAVQQAGRATRAEQQVALFAEALAEPGARILAAEVVGGGQAVAVVSETGAVFAARGLDDLGSELDYQLWVIDDGTPVSAGVLEVGGGATQLRVDRARPGSTLAMTVEPAGGSRQPTTDPVVYLPEPPPAEPPAEGEAPQA
jgi:anti-sigma-K factor RskA